MLLSINDYGDFFYSYNSSNQRGKTQCAWGKIAWEEINVSQELCIIPVLGLSRYILNLLVYPVHARFLKERTKMTKYYPCALRAPILVIPRGKRKTFQEINAYIKYIQSAMEIWKERKACQVQTTGLGRASSERWHLTREMKKDRTIYVQGQKSDKELSWKVKEKETRYRDKKKQGIQGKGMI